MLGEVGNLLGARLNAIGAPHRDQAADQFNLGSVNRGRGCRDGDLVYRGTRGFLGPVMVGAGKRLLEDGKSLMVNFREIGRIVSTTFCAVLHSSTKRHAVALQLGLAPANDQPQSMTVIV